MIYFNKLIGICINRQESQKVVDNYFVGTIKKIAKAIFFMYIKRWDSKRNVPSSGWFKARLNAGKNSPVDYFCDASASGPTISTRRLNRRTRRKARNQL